MTYTPPRYDDVYWSGVKSLDRIAAGLLLMRGMFWEWFRDQCDLIERPNPWTHELWLMTPDRREE